MSLIVKPQSSYFDKSFNQTSSHSYILSIQIDSHGLSYSIYHPEKNKFIGFESFRFIGLKNEDQIADELDSLIAVREWLINDFKKVNLIFSYPVSTLIPEALFEQTKKEVYLEFNYPGNDNLSVGENVLRNAEAVNIFNIPKTFEKKARNIWTSSQLYHSSSVFIESLLINYKNKTSNNTVFVQVNDEYFEVVYIKDGKLNFHNIFKFKTKEDFIFFLLTTIEQLKLNPEDVKVVLSGNIEKSSIYYEMVYQYIRNSEFIERNETFNYSYLLEKLPHPKYYILFNMLQCE